MKRFKASITFALTLAILLIIGTSVYGAILPIASVNIRPEQTLAISSTITASYVRMSANHTSGVGTLRADVQYQAGLFWVTDVSVIVPPREGTVTVDSSRLTSRPWRLRLTSSGAVTGNGTIIGRGATTFGSAH